MGEISVSFEIPPHLEAGLSAGQLERVGGVIVDTASKQIVAWLRESINVESTQRALEAIGQLTRVGVALSAATLGVQVVSLAVTVGMLRDIQTRLERMDKKLDELKELIIAEFKSNRMTGFKSALDAAEEYLRGDSERYGDAVKGLFESIEHFTNEFNGYLKQYKADKSQKLLILAQDTLTRRILAISVYVKCHQKKDYENAKTKLKTYLEEVEKDAQALAVAWLETPALYFHKRVGQEHLKRFLYIQSWLKNPRASKRNMSVTVIFEVLEELRRDFWNSQLEQQVLKPEKKRVQKTAEAIPVVGQKLAKPEAPDPLGEIIERLGYVEALMENYDRLLGYELTLSSDRLSVLESIEIDESQLTAETPLAFIVDEEALAQARKRLIG